MANTAENLNEYIVFEPDQVLTNDHLNEIFDYLDNQERLTRNKFIGIGIVCGLEVASDGQTSISISNGCGITSEGYSIVLNSTIATAYTHYIPYPGINEPSDLFFKYLDKQPLPFYEPFCENKSIFQLITDDEASSATKAVPLFSANSINLENYVVVLFLEASETDLRNCSMQDCNNNGKKMDFTIRPLLVNINDIPSIPSVQRQKTNTPGTAPDIGLLRYNVPYNDLNSSDDVLNAFKNIISATANNITLVAQIQDAYNWCYARYGRLLNETSFDFSNLNNVVNAITKDTSPIHVQYVYDYLNDLVKAYYEFIEKTSCLVLTACCPDETLFPLHLVLGEASPAENRYIKSQFRQYFIYSPLFSNQCNGANELRFLYERMKLMLAEFNFPTVVPQGGRFFDIGFVIRNRQVPVKITPSQYESFPLSQRSIPYYYLTPNNDYDIYKNWNYRKMIEGKTGSILSYNADKSPDSGTYANNPLLYDTERFNFFRIEGHIGYNYSQALSTIQGQVQQYNLPFNVVAVSADSLSANATLPDCDITDIETSYRLLVSGFSSAIRIIYSFIINIPYPYNNDKLLPYFGAFDSFVANTLSKSQSPVDFSPGTAYVKGNFLTKYCGLDTTNADTFGYHYINEKIIFFPLFSTLNIGKVMKAVRPGIKRTALPEVPVAAENLGILNWDGFFNSLINTFIGYVDSLMGYLLTNDIASFNVNDFANKFSPYITDVSSFRDFLTSIMESAVKSNTDPLRQDILLDEFIDEVEKLLSPGLGEKLLTLKKEYTSRLNDYEAQLNFLNYFKKHPGLEHKAGVPKGGTFVLVYHQQQTSPAPVTGGVVSPANNIVVNADRLNVLREFILKNVSNIRDVSDTELSNVLTSAPPAAASQYSLVDGEVIADFYIPYLCCSDCSPIAYILPTQAPPAPQQVPVIKMADTFCDNNTKPVQIDVSIPGGTFQIDGKEAKTFIPATAGAGKHTIIYTVKNVPSLPKTVTVLSTPQHIDFVAAVIQDGNNFDVKFTPSIVTTDFNYEWRFDAQFKDHGSNESTPSIQLINPSIVNDGKTVVFLGVSNNCGKTSIEKEFRFANGQIIPVGNPVGIRLKKSITRKKSIGTKRKR